MPIDYPYLPDIDAVVNIFGKTYSSTKDRLEIANRLRSLFWSTYRKSFPPIVVRTGPTSDTGWGCMHRCGQMMLAEAITRIRLGEDWRWTPGCQDEAYCQLRRTFQDTKLALYSIQNIVMIGMALDKPIGSWFGPNTVAQVIKKLCAYDPTINWYVHISVEDGLIIDEIKNACRKCVSGRLFESTALAMPPTPTDSLEEEWDLEAFKARFGDDVEFVEPASYIHGPVTRDADEDFLEVILPQARDLKYLQPLSDSFVPSTSPEPPSESVLHDEGQSTSVTDLSPLQSTWRPLLLFIPLRLGVQQSNPCYFSAVKAVLEIPQSIGIMGGRPSHAVWIVGVIGEEDVLYLDPHTTQSASLGDELTDEDDQTHHCDSPARMPLSSLDPSMVLGFLCPTEASFDQLCTSFEHHVLGLSVNGGEHPLFEMRRTRPFNLPPMPAVLRSKLSAGPKESTSSNVKPNLPMPESSTSSLQHDQEGPFGDAVNAVRELLSKCNRVATDTVRSLTIMNSQAAVSGSEFEVL